MSKRFGNSSDPPTTTNTTTTDHQSSLLTKKSEGSPLNKPSVANLDDFKDDGDSDDSNDDNFVYKVQVTSSNRTNEISSSNGTAGSMYGSEKRDTAQTQDSSGSGSDFVNQVLTKKTDPLEEHLRMIMSSRGGSTGSTSNKSTDSQIREMQGEVGENEDEEEEEGEDIKIPESQSQSLNEIPQVEEAEEDPQIEAEIAEMKSQMIQQYILSKHKLKYLVKKNAYLQDRLYQASLKKGLLENSTVLSELTQQYQPDPKKLPNYDEEDELDEDEEEEEGEYFEHNVDLFSEAHESEFGDEMTVDSYASSIQNSSTAHAGAGKSAGKGSIAAGGGTITKLAAQQPKRRTKRGLGEILTQEIKYQKTIKEIQKWENSKLLFSLKHKQNIIDLGKKEEIWLNKHDKKLVTFLQDIRRCSEISKNSISGQPMDMIEMINSLNELGKSHINLCQQLIRMYHNRRALEFSIKKLEETEIQSPGLSMLEYEQLQSENQVLKDRLDDRDRDVENIKKKIAHCVQILAHFREKMLNIEGQNSVGAAQLKDVNEKVFGSRQINDQIANRLGQVKKEKKTLVVDSGLIDNSHLLHDFEQTQLIVRQMKNSRNRMYREYHTGVKEIAELQRNIKKAEAEEQFLTEGGNNAGQCKCK